MAEVLVSIRRLQKFMLYDEVSTRADKSMVYEKNTSNELDGIKKDDDNKHYENGNKINNDETTNNKGTIKLENVSAKWVNHDKTDTLSRINLTIRPGELIAVVGQVGTGKSSLLNVILRELPTNHGKVEVKFKKKSSIKYVKYKKT